jgi:hypothetical protein
LNTLLRKNQKFQWTEECQNAFDDLKQMFTEGPVLRMPEPIRAFQIEADTSKFASRAVLTQEDSNGARHPIAFISKTFNNTEQWYEIYDRELLAIMQALREWRHYLHGNPHPTTIYSDHRNLQYFREPHKLKDRQQRWIPELAKYNYELLHLPGHCMTQADALSRRPDHLPNKEEESVEHILLPDNVFVKALRLDSEQRLYDEQLQQQIISASSEDPDAIQAFQQLRTEKIPYRSPPMGRLEV